MTAPVDWSRLVAEYGSPLYAYDLGGVRDAHAALAAALPAQAGILYSLKANPHPGIVAQLRRLGCGAEVSSRSELVTALDAGIDAADIVYTGPGKSAAEVGQALRTGARLFSVDSAAQLDTLREVASGLCVDVSVLLRVNPDRSSTGASLAMTGVASPFGVDARLLLAQPHRFAPSAGCDVVGLHFYLGSNLPSREALGRQFAESIELAAELCRALGVRPRILDLGGGFPRSYLVPEPPVDLAGLGEVVDDALAAAFSGPAQQRPRLLFESGRYLVGAAGWLVATAVDVKVSRDRTFAVLDSGINHLGGMSGLGRLPRIRPEVTRVGDPTAEPRPTDVVGPLCTPLDFWTRSSPIGVRAGDHVVVPNAGAYGLTASLLAFLGRDCPAEVVLDHGQVVDASRLIYERRPIPATTDRHLAGRPQETGAA
ncbi:type III PLP-dependent enzyme [Catellatospora sp. NPDC049111]|uniref:type III PLP-dependent enzyme n=1 Tax=Catellatospora sp. NPDC049111 TaxID=3155271 RepID=UPI00340F8E1B